jgi:hypothetical protein
MKMCKYLTSFYITTSFEPDNPKLVHRCEAYYAARGDEDCTAEHAKTCFHRKCKDDPLDIMAMFENPGGVILRRC